MDKIFGSIMSDLHVAINFPWTLSQVRGVYKVNATAEREVWIILSFKCQDFVWGALCILLLPLCGILTTLNIVARGPNFKISCNKKSESKIQACTQARIRNNKKSITTVH